MKTGPNFLLLFAGLAALSCALAAPTSTPPVILYSDLDSGPGTGGQDDMGVFVTIWGKNFLDARDTGNVTIGEHGVAKYLSWSNDRIVFQVGTKAMTGNIVVTTADSLKSNGLPFTIRPGNIYFIDEKVPHRGSGTFSDPWRSPASFYNQIHPGDTAYFRGGTYHGNWGGDWGDRNLALGAGKGGKPGRPVALLGYPGETATLVAPQGYHGNMVLTDTTRTVASYVTVANLKFEGAGDCLGGGGFWRNEKSGGSNIRVVGNHFSARYKGNTMSGLVGVNSDHWRIFGNEFADTGTTPPINNNHAVYIQTGASDIEVAWNHFHDLRMGHVIQVHTDTPYRHENILIHDNVITARNSSDARGINVGNAKAGTHGSIYNNLLVNIGQDFSAIAIYSGDWQIYNNTLVGIRAGGGMVWLSGQYGGSPTAEIANNALVSDGRSPYIAAINGARASQITADSNLYFGYAGHKERPNDKRSVAADPQFRDPARGDFRLRPGSPAIDAGSAKILSVAKRDLDGTLRPQRRSVDIGAFEFAQ